MPARTQPTRFACTGRCTALLIAGAMLGSVGCAQERVVGVRGLLHGLPGAQSGLPAVQQDRTVASALLVPEGGIRQEIDSDTVVLYAKRIQHLMAHITHAIQHDERDLFVEQILSSATVDEFVQRGLDPGLAFDEVVRRQRDVFTLFAAMPFGETTPGLSMQPIGTNQFRLAVPNSSIGDLKWVGIDTVFEDGNFRLRWFVTPSTLRRSR